MEKCQKFQPIKLARVAVVTNTNIPLFVNFVIILDTLQAYCNSVLIQGVLQRIQDWISCKLYCVMGIPSSLLFHFIRCVTDTGVVRLRGHFYKQIV